MVKIKVSKQIKDKEVRNFEVDCDRMTAVVVKKGQCSLTMSNISLSEAIGAIGEALKYTNRETTHLLFESWAVEPDEHMDIVLDIEVKEEGQEKPKTEQITIQRGILMVKQKGQYEIVPLNICYEDAMGSMDIIRMLQLINMSITGAMASAMQRPALPGMMPGGGMPLNIPGIGGRPRR